MSRTFKFSENEDVVLNLNGVEFSVNVADTETIVAIDSFSKILIKISNTPVNEDDNTREVIDNMIETIASGLDVILGDGSVEKIYSGRKMNFANIAELGRFVIGEIGDAKQSLEKNLLAKYSPQRIAK